MSSQKLNPVAAQRLKALRNLHEIEPTLDEIIALHECGKEIQDPPCGRSLSSLAAPARAGSLVVWPFTIGAGEWYADVMWPAVGSTKRGLYGLGFTLAYSRDPAFLMAVNPRRVEKVVKKWIKTLDCTATELADAIDYVAPPEEEDTKKKDLDELEQQRAEIHTNYDEVVGWLCLRCGGTPDFWRWGESKDFALDQINRQAQIDAAGGDGINPHDPIIKGNIRMNQLCKDIIEAHKADG